MTAALIEQEIYLLERYSSLDYFGTMRDHFATMLKASNNALTEFMAKPPPDYRSRHLSQQPDAVWGERIIPNLQWVLDGLNEGYILLSHGDLNALGQANNVTSSFTAINRDYSWDWMPKTFFDIADQANSEAWIHAMNISATRTAQWCHGDLSLRYNEPTRGPLNPPPTWPQYRLNTQVQVKTGDKVPHKGIYVPDIAKHCGQLLLEGQEAWEATARQNPDDPNSQSCDYLPATWTLVERIADEGGSIPGEEPWRAQAAQRLRCEGGLPCPHEGWWFTPAAEGKRHFKQGEIMPSIGADYGLTIWQWCVPQ